MSDDAEPVAYAEVLRRWQCDAEFRAYFIKILADCPFAAFRWETPPLTTACAHRLFEFVLVDSPSLERKPDIKTFEAYFSGDPEGVVEFPNLGNDAVLVVPCPGEPLSAYSHLGAFVRQAPESQQHALWALVGEAMQRRLNDQPVWLSTAGGGVSWLHVRLDDWPKYYRYAPYREIR